MNRFIDLRFDDPDLLGLLPTDKHRRLEPKRLLCGHGFFWSDCPCCGDIECVTGACSVTCASTVYMEITSSGTNPDAMVCEPGSNTTDCSKLSGTWTLTGGASCSWDETYPLTDCSIDVDFVAVMFCCEDTPDFNSVWGSAYDDITAVGLIKQRSGFTHQCNSFDLTLPDPFELLANCSSATDESGCTGSMRLYT